MQEKASNLAAHGKRGLASVGEGSIYPVLGRLEREGLVATHREACNVGPPRKYYSASPSGRRALGEGVRTWREVRGELDSIRATIEAEVAG